MIQSGWPLSFLVDPASQHIAYVDGQDIRREELCLEIGIKLFEAISHWSAEGQPADQIHNLIKLYEDIECRATTGEQHDVFDPLQAISAAVAAYRKVPRHCRCHAWTDTGLVSIPIMEQLTGLNVSASKEE